MRQLLSLSLTVCLIAPAVAQESPLKASMLKFEVEANLLLAKLRRATTPDEKQAVKTEYAALEQKYQAGWVGLAAKEPTTTDAFDVFVQAVGADGDTGKTARTLIGTHHADKPYAWQAAVPLAQTAKADAVAALTRMSESNAEPKGRGIGTAALGLLHKKLAMTGPPAERMSHQTTAKKVLAAAAEKYPDVRISSSQTVAEFAADHAAGIDNIAHLRPGGTAPAEAGVDLDGKPIALADYRGKVVLIDFWATWCPGCMKLVPHLKELSAKHAAAGFVVVGVNLDTDADELKTEVGRHGIGWRSFRTDAGKGPKLADRWNVELMPTLYLLDRAGVVRKVWTGGHPEEVAAEVAKLVAEK